MKQTTSRSLSLVCDTTLVGCCRCIVEYIVAVFSIVTSDVLAGGIFGLVTLFELARCGLGAIVCVLLAAMAICLWCFNQENKILQAKYQLPAAGLDPDNTHAMTANGNATSITSKKASKIPRVYECPMAQQSSAAAVAPGAETLEHLNTEVAGPATPTQSTLASPVLSRLSSPAASRHSSVAGKADTRVLSESTHLLAGSTAAAAELAVVELTCKVSAAVHLSPAAAVAAAQALGGINDGSNWRPSLVQDSATDTVLQDSKQQQQPPLKTCPSQNSSAEPFRASPWSVGQHSDQNQRLYMEDRACCRDLRQEAAFAGCKRAGFFAVFDGHAGHEAAEYLENHLLSYVISTTAEELCSRPLDALKAAVNRAEQDINRSFGAASCNAGSTLLAVLLIDDKLHIANVGDSRAVLVRSTQAQQLTRDHKPTCSLEQQRIRADDPAAEISSDGYMYGELAVARDIGSPQLKRDPARRALIATPDLVTVQLTQDDDFLVLATDGLWDKVNNAEMARVARRSLATGSRDAGGAAKALVGHAQRCSSSDNISVVTLLLHDRAILLPKSNSMLFRRRALASEDALM